MYHYGDVVYVLCKVHYCSARDWDRIRITWGNPQSGCTDICSYSKRATVGVRAPYATSKTPVWSESSVDEHNLYFARSAIIGYLAVETWRVKTELIIITILHIIIITTSILNLGFKNICGLLYRHDLSKCPRPSNVRGRRHFDPLFQEKSKT
jgi:hypothetical protein